MTWLKLLPHINKLRFDFDRDWHCLFYIIFSLACKRIYFDFLDILRVLMHVNIVLIISHNYHKANKRSQGMHTNV